MAHETAEIKNVNMEEIKIRELIIPDVHCRTFWKEPVERFLSCEDDTKIVFLGDYLDGYEHEWEDRKYIKDGITRLEEIIDIKKKHPNNVVLLLGNHDCGYAIDESICSSRMDYENKNIIKKLFQDNRECFQLIYKDEDVLFSHAGVHRGFLKRTGIDDKQFDSILNNAWLTDNMDILWTLCMYDGYRGFSVYEYGSPIWADVRSYFKKTEPVDENLGYQIFGHTQLAHDPIITEFFACLDCRKCFTINGKNEIKEV